MRNPRVARRYAGALMDAARSDHSIDRVDTDLRHIGDVIRLSRDLKLMLDSPVVPEKKKRAVIRELFASQVAGTTLAFIDLLVTKHREPLLPEIVDAFHALRDESEGILEVQVTSAVPLSAPQESRLASELSRSTGKNVRLRIQQDPCVRGGILVRMGDTVLNGTIARQLELLRGRFITGADTPGPVHH